jgi:hypothetical protein
LIVQAFGAPVTLHASLDAPPGGIEDGLAVKLATVGPEGRASRGPPGAAAEGDDGLATLVLVHPARRTNPRRLTKPMPRTIVERTMLHLRLFRHEAASGSVRHEGFHPITAISARQSFSL